MQELTKYGWKVAKFIYEDDKKYKESVEKNKLERWVTPFEK